MRRSGRLFSDFPRGQTFSQNEQKCKKLGSFRPEVVWWFGHRSDDVVSVSRRGHQIEIVPRSHPIH
jgi:hypothetical protein